MPVDFENSSAMTASNSASGEASVSSGNQPPPPPPPAAAASKKKRSLPGMPDPDAEVMALSPKSLLATNRFICEVCKKGFQRDQNLQLHRRGHNLPWKLRQRIAGKEVRKKVYVCPETSCVHHDPSRALGDLTGIKKHFCRKHGEKKWKCERCSKKYAVHSDWKAHFKTCGTKEYRCDCGTLFSRACRRDSFITHRAFCDALAEETAKVQTIVQSPPFLEDDLPAERQEPESASTGILQYLPPPPFAVDNNNGTCTSSGGGNNNTTSIFASLFVSSSSTSAHAPTTDTGFSDLPSSVNHRPVPTALHLSPFIAPTPQLSATALLQKAAQMGAAATSSSFLRGLGLAATSSSPPTHQRSWEPEAVAPVGMGLGIPDLFGPKRATLDLLGLGMGSGSAGGGLSAFMTSIGSRLDIGPGPSSGP